MSTLQWHGLASGWAPPAAAVKSNSNITEGRTFGAAAWFAVGSQSKAQQTAGTEAQLGGLGRPASNSELAATPLDHLSGCVGTGPARARPRCSSFRRPASRRCRSGRCSSTSGCNGLATALLRGDPAADPSCMTPSLPSGSRQGGQHKGWMRAAGLIQVEVECQAELNCLQKWFLLVRQRFFQISRLLPRAGTAAFSASCLEPPTAMRAAFLPPVCAGGC